MGKSKELSIDLKEQWYMVQLENTNYHLLLRENWSGWLRVSQKPPKSTSVMNKKLLEDSSQCPQSSYTA